MRTRVLALLMIAGIGATTGLAAGSHEERVAKLEADFKARRDMLLQSIAELDVSLQAHGVEAKGTALAKATLNEMSRAAALWRDLKSRSTKTQQNAKASLEKYLRTANEQLAAPRQRFALIKKAEFEAWAQANPQAARLLEIQRRAEAAEAAARDAEMEARNARSAAARAESDAQDAQSEAQRADRRARAAQQRSDRAEDALWRNGIQSW